MKINVCLGDDLQTIYSSEADGRTCRTAQTAERRAELLELKRAAEKTKLEVAYEDAHCY